MKKITKEYEVFEFDELSKEAKEKVLEEYRHINVDDDNWSQYILEDMTTDRLDKMGFENAEIFYSGFWSQGDGASFKAEINANKLCKVFELKRKYSKLLSSYEITGIITRSGYYYHSNTMRIEIDFDPIKDVDNARQSLLDDLSDKFEDEILKIAKDEADDIYKELKEEYEYLTDDKAVIETLKANEFTFLADGAFFNK